MRPSRTTGSAPGGVARRRRCLKVGLRARLEKTVSGGATTVDICDIVVTCKKYATGYDEWRICADPPGGDVW